ncbi:MAG: hypothetical protein QHC40_05115 [Sphingobium sp.]|uniref:hypothetical protein n=1 Tax=Sphingomonadales TaxID=204457 RepID=UPI001FE1EF5C|nr:MULTISPECIES: hypothetical protein [Sphingomonadaceae]MDF0489246.1 hypothetical protein [Sphingomonas pollutisoli]MDF0544039.1 hypothetical protein [Sphingobium arseniciresistens]MDX3899875.1 hypothetical protein [Sphingobium sp.]
MNDFDVDNSSTPSKDRAMIAAAKSNRATAIGDCGILISHRDNWWFVEFVEPMGNPGRPRLLSGNISTGFAHRLGLMTGPLILNPRVETLNPGSDAWSAECNLLPTIEGGDPGAIDYDIDSHVLDGEADALHQRLARVAIDSHLFPIPAGFISVLIALPQDSAPVLTIRTSVYARATCELLTAYYTPEHQLKEPWRDISGDLVSDSGNDILGWMPARDWIRPR